MFQFDGIDEIRLGLLDKNILHLSGSVDNDMSVYVGEAMARLAIRDCPDVEIIIASKGGDFESGLDIYDALRLYPSHKTGIVHMQASSMAAIILQACEVRKCARHSYLLIHHISRETVSLDVLRNPEKLAKTVDDMEKRQERLYQILSQRTGKDKETIRKVCEEDRLMTAEEALEFGLIDEII